MAANRLAALTSVLLIYVLCCCILSIHEVGQRRRSSLSSSNVCGGSSDRVNLYANAFLFACAYPEQTNVDDAEEGSDADQEPLLQSNRSLLSTTADASDSTPDQKPLGQILAKAMHRALGGGLSGAVAGAVQVITLMWLRTIVNYQCRYGTTLSQAMRTLLNQGGIRRLYRGLGFALLQAPLARFGSTAANDGVNALLASLQWTRSWGPERTTMIASFVVALWRIFLMPIDTMKTVLQVDSYEGFRSLMRRVKAGKIGALYQGAIASAISAAVGHYPWFTTYNVLSHSEWLQKTIPSALLRNAGIGLAASAVSDTVVNAIRVVKTTKQSIGSKHTVSYGEAIRMILAADGWKGLFGRGLRTRIYTNALQSLVFTVIWRGLADRWGRQISNNDNAEETQSSGKSTPPGAVASE